MVDARSRDFALDFKMAEKGKNYSVQVFKTMQGVDAWIGPFDIVFAAYCCGIFFPAGVMFNITSHLLNDRSFKVCQVLATKCSEYSVVLLSRHNFMFVSP